MPTKTRKTKTSVKRKVIIPLTKTVRSKAEIKKAVKEAKMKIEE